MLVKSIMENLVKLNKKTMDTLIEKAKKLKETQRKNFEITPEVIELALAWSKDEVSITQCEKVLGVREHNKIYAILARALKASARSPQEKVKEADKTITPPKANTIKPLRKASDEAPSKY